LQKVGDKRTAFLGKIIDKHSFEYPGGVQKENLDIFNTNVLTIEKNINLNINKNTE
jgi:hypothetical protein